MSFYLRTGVVLLVINDLRRLRSMARRLRDLGCLVFCSPDLDQAADLLRSGFVPQFIFIHVTRENRSVEGLRDELAIRLPGWSVQLDDRGDEGDGVDRGSQN